MNTTGRYNEPPSTVNLGTDIDDFPEFEPFRDDAEDSEEDGEPEPRGPGELSVQAVDMCRHINMPKHRTQAYVTDNLVVRRGQEFVLHVTFSRSITPRDRFRLEFLIGSNPAIQKRTLEWVTFGTRDRGRWSGRILDSRGPRVVLGVTPRADSIIGRFRMYITLIYKWGLKRTRRNPDTDCYLLFNCWSVEDAVYYPDEPGRQEYVLNDNGVIYMGSRENLLSRDWVYGQFERGVLDACIYMLDACRMPITTRGNAIHIVRKGSAVINSQDENGVLVGNWSENFSGGTAPTLWTGSVNIMLQYANTGTPVRYGQCWVFAGVFNTFLRCLGIPARVISNFNSAHDNNGNLKIELIFKSDGSADMRNTHDSIWNYHCWNEVFMRRPDLPPRLSGWQVVDATPQETSDGLYRCGPASVVAIKEGLVGHAYDGPFIFAEVNSNVIYVTRDKYGNDIYTYVDKRLVGTGLFTKRILVDKADDITLTYKYPEGSVDEEKAMQTAESFGLARDQPAAADPAITVTLSVDQMELGMDVELKVELHNRGDAALTVKALLTCAVVFYTGVVSNRFKSEALEVTVAPDKKETVLVKIEAEEYLKHMGFQRFLAFTLVGSGDSGGLKAVKVVYLRAPDLQLKVSGVQAVGQDMFVNVSFTNTFKFPLYNVTVALEGPRVMSNRQRFYNILQPQASFNWKESFVPETMGKRTLVAVMSSANLCEIWGKIEFVVEDKLHVEEASD
ncbi:coagulation factor XIII A chain-like [Corythoichthys intestinalis]|uniref:coagulation factor XIII A chain-like n=1 Tax=Corythoichthys intestinalis TaxID=161448 RepID=UPI0025A67059|nr:coagulation factor XIII A chain-like [Corythoichthys intestinalis]